MQNLCSSMVASTLKNAQETHPHNMYFVSKNNTTRYFYLYEQLALCVYSRLLVNKCAVDGHYSFKRFMSALHQNGKVIISLEEIVWVIIYNSNGNAHIYIVCSHFCWEGCRN